MYKLPFKIKVIVNNQLRLRLHNAKSRTYSGDKAICMNNGSISIKQTKLTTTFRFPKLTQVSHTPLSSQEMLPPFLT